MLMVDMSKCCYVGWLKQAYMTGDNLPVDGAIFFATSTWERLGGVKF